MNPDESPVKIGSWWRNRHTQEIAQIKGFSAREGHVSIELAYQGRRRGAYTSHRVGFWTEAQLLQHWEVIA